MSGCKCRPHLERAIRDAGFGTNEAFGRAVGYSGRAVSDWLECVHTPSQEAGEAIARVLEVSPGADCDEVRESDLDWLLEPVDEIDYIEWALRRCDG